MDQSPLSPQSIIRNWYWRFGKLKYDHIQNRGKDIQEYELGGACHSLGKNESGSTTSLISQLTVCLPQSFANKVDQRVRREEGRQHEWVV
ncbi:uncharacterized protein EURHEDRAFT_416566, partial [Aspergillus ruber CBS 135680]